MVALAATAAPRDRPRVTDYYALGLCQWQVHFVDVDIQGDTRVFIDPTALRRDPSPWGHECVALIQDFFRVVVEAIQNDNHRKARILLRGLREPNETRLGLSRGRSRGRGVGGIHADGIYLALRDSKAVKTGLLVDLEDTLLMVETIGADLVSDIATNLIREPLIRYTQATCREYGIPMAPGQLSGRLWDMRVGEWSDGRFVELPTPGRRLLLVPKVIVRRKMEYSKDEFLSEYIFEFLAEQEIASKSALVHLLKDGRPKVLKSELRDKYGDTKGFVADIARDHPELLLRYREKKAKDAQKPLQHEDFSDIENVPSPDWDELLAAMRGIPPGPATATAYHRAVKDLISALLYPWLTLPQVEVPINQARKRIDITFLNSATKGFFQWVGLHQSASHVFVECKNYSGDPGNPELDQLTGRFSHNRGRVGILACRPFEDKEAFIRRCRDSANDGHGFVMPLDDDDLAELVAARKEPDYAERISAFFKARWDRLVM